MQLPVGGLARVANRDRTVATYQDAFIVRWPALVGQREIASGGRGGEGAQRPVGMSSCSSGGRRRNIRIKRRTSRSSSLPTFTSLCLTSSSLVTIPISTRGLH